MWTKAEADGRILRHVPRALARRYVRFYWVAEEHGEEEQRARDLFYGLWISDLFMRRV